MKAVFILAASCILLLFSCNKTAGGKIIAGSWLLVQKASSIASAYTTITMPAKDYSVLLVLNANGN